MIRKKLTQDDIMQSSGSQRLVVGDPQNRILHNLATHISQT